MMNVLYTDIVNVLRRNNTTASRDSLNNPAYGNPVNWNPVYMGIKVRILWSNKELIFEATGEIVRHSGLIYVPPQYSLLPEDRILTVNTPGNLNGVEYVLHAITPAFMPIAGKVDHYEGNLEIPIT
jgi:hypothetical protein